MKKLIVTSTFCLFCALAQAEAGKDSFDAAYQAAETARQQAAAAGYEWRDTSKLLSEAKDAAAAGDYAAAVKLADEAKLQGELAVQQAAHEADAWKNRVPR